jgi:hypothetical protein
MMVKFSQHGMPAMPVSAPLAQSRLVRRLLQAQGDPVKQRVLAWLLDVDDARLRTFGLSHEDIAILRACARQ